jgi:protein-tyrosine phosphatase
VTNARVLAWDGCVNVREIGGLPTEDGGEIQPRVVVRADSIRGLTDTGWQALEEYGIALAIDLRSDHELEDDPDREAPIPVVHIPIDPNAHWAAFNFPTMQEGYEALLDHFPEAFARAVETVATTDGPVVLHCAGGRDRTGIAVALMLRLAGVHPEEIAADHALSDESWAPHNEAWFAEAEDEAERERRKRVAKPAGRTMVDVLAEIDRRFGGPRQYLTAAGASEANLDRLVLRLRGR